MIQLEIMQNALTRDRALEISDQTRGETPYTPKNHFGVSEPPNNLHGWGYTHTNLKSRRTDL